MTREELQALVQEATGTPCEIEENSISRELWVRTGCHYLGSEELDGLKAAGNLKKIYCEGGQLTIIYSNR